MQRGNSLIKNHYVVGRKMKENQLILLNLRTGEIALLNSTAASFWSLIDGTRTSEQITQIIHNRFPSANVATIEQDILRLMRKLTSKGFARYAQE